ncbi:helix-turn-helix domain-containing protein [Blastococcus brunescens]|uniref:Helix-turn-helix domain-containing protein n=1 Tax=Blastococcus brunescens TaxID=1564165 RepID=A0ABZ1B3Z2_9ACTN|nr:helix-turn-helix domain-containing protein [Blastococcus sp. BMG 8361]WRL65102.1 helix-turn-helix domain-containing protein [Blastococcus sp. BMG 8361]
MTAVSTALRVLEHVAVHQPIGVSDLARALELPKSTVQRTLKELSDAHWVEQESDGSRRWVQTVKLLNLAREDGGRSIRARALPVMRSLLRQVDENIHLALRSGSTAALIEKLESSRSVRPVDPSGCPIPSTCPPPGRPCSRGRRRTTSTSTSPRHTETFRPTPRSSTLLSSPTSSRRSGPAATP